MPPDERSPAGLLTDEERALATRGGLPIEVVERYLPAVRDAVLRGRLFAIAADWQTALDAHPSLLPESVDPSGKVLSPSAAIALILQATVQARAEWDAEWLSKIGHLAERYLEEHGGTGRTDWPTQREVLCTELRDALEQGAGDVDATAALAATVLLRHAFAPRSRLAGLLAAGGVRPPQTAEHVARVRSGIVRSFQRRDPRRADVERVVRKALLALGLESKVAKNLFSYR